MKKSFLFLAHIAFSFAFGFSAHAQERLDACKLISTEQINKVLGSKVGEGVSTIQGKRCAHKSADNKSSASMEYYDWQTANSAAEMLKMTYDGNSKSIASGKKAVGIYTAIKPFPEAGPSAFIMTGDGDVMSGGNVVRIQFGMGSKTFTFDTQGLDKDKVAAKAAGIYSIIKGNNK